MKTLLIAILLLATCTFSLSGAEKKPKLVLLIVVDQLPYEYLSRYGEYFSDDGFNLLMKRGANFTNCRYEYAYTKTACGHATISTGANPDINGIVGNSWYDRARKGNVNCVNDDSVRYVGTDARGGRSPKNLLTGTLADMVRLSTNFRSKVVGVSNKDRSAILTAGKYGTAYWMRDSSFITSTYYMNTLPPWVKEFNASGIFQKYFGKKWELLQPEITALLCDSDSNDFEYGGARMGTTFPHIITGEDPAKITGSYYQALEYSPYSTEILFEFARKAFAAESLGKRGVTDMLTVCISATDVIGHGYGPQSREVFDNLLRTDAYLAEFFSFLDKQIGLNNCAIALSGDHGIAPIPEYVKKKSPKADAGRISSDSVKKYSERVLRSVYGIADSAWVRKVVEFNIYLDHDALNQKGITMDAAAKTLRDSLLSGLPVTAAFTQSDLTQQRQPDKLRRQVALSNHPERSGDLMYVLNQFWTLDGEMTGTNHGSPWEYDAHVPLLLFGNNVSPGDYTDEVSPADLAPTLAALLGIEFPTGRTGRVLGNALK